MEYRRRNLVSGASSRKRDRKTLQLRMESTIQMRMIRTRWIACKQRYFGCKKWYWYMLPVSRRILSLLLLSQFPLSRDHVWWTDMAVGVSRVGWMRFRWKEEILHSTIEQLDLVQSASPRGNELINGSVYEHFIIAFDVCWYHYRLWIDEVAQLVRLQQSEFDPHLVPYLSWVLASGPLGFLLLTLSCVVTDSIANGMVNLSGWVSGWVSEWVAMVGRFDSTQPLSLVGNRFDQSKSKIEREDGEMGTWMEMFLSHWCMNCIVFECILVMFRSVVRFEIFPKGIKSNRTELN